MLLERLMQNFFTLSGPAMEDTPCMRSFAHLSLAGAIPDEATFLNFRHLLEENDLAEDISKQVNVLLARKGLVLKHGSIMDSSIIAASSSTKNSTGERGPEIGRVEQIANLLHGKELNFWAGLGYLRVVSGVQHKDLQRNIAKRLSSVARMPEGRAKKQACRQEHSNANTLAKLEHPFRVIERQFGLTKVRFESVAKNTAYMATLFALVNSWMACKKLMAMMGTFRAKPA